MVSQSPGLTELKIPANNISVTNFPNLGQRQDVSSASILSSNGGGSNALPQLGGNSRPPSHSLTGVSGKQSNGSMLSSTMPLLARPAPSSSKTSTESPPPNSLSRAKSRKKEKRSQAEVHSLYLMMSLYRLLWSFMSCFRWNKRSSMDTLGGQALLRVLYLTGISPAMPQMAMYSRERKKTRNTPTRRGFQRRRSCDDEQEREESKQAA